MQKGISGAFAVAHVICLGCCELHASKMVDTAELFVCLCPLCLSSKRDTAEAWHNHCVLTYLNASCCLGVLKRAVLWLERASGALACADYQVAFVYFDNISLHPAYLRVGHPYF